MVDYWSGKSHLARSGNASCPLKKVILPARENIVQIKFLRKLKLIIRCCDDEELSPSEFCMGRLLFVKKFTLYFRRLNFFLWSIVIVLFLQQVHCQKPPVYTAESCSNESVFLFFSTKSEQTAIQQSHIINPLLTSFAQSVRESIAFGFYRTDLAPSSLGLYENLRQYFPVQTSHSVNKSLIFQLDNLFGNHCIYIYTVVAKKVVMCKYI